LQESDSALADIVSANPDSYMQTIRELEAQLTQLTGTYTTTTGYLTALNGNISELSTLQRLARITTTNLEFEAEADRIYAAVFTN
jgi:phage shock protein A